MTNLEKEAQRRSLVRGLGRAINPVERARRFFYADYEKIYLAVKMVDDKMREKALNKRIGLKAELHKARMAMKEREFPKVLYYSLKVLDSINDIFSDVNQLDKIRDEMIEKYYGKKTDLSTQQLQELQSVLGRDPSKIESKASYKDFEKLLYVKAIPDPFEFTNENFYKAGGPMEWIKEHLPSMKGIKRDLIDRLFSNRAAKHKAAAQEALDIAEDAFKDALSVFDSLDANLTNFSEYIRIANEAKNNVAAAKDRLSVLYQANFADIITNTTQPSENTGPAQPPQSPSPAEQTAQAPAQQEQLVVPEGELVSEVQVPNKPNQDDWSYITPAEQEGMYDIAYRDEVLNLVKKARLASNSGDNGIASALLVKASEVCDNNQAVGQSVLLLQIAERILKDE